MAPRSRTTSYAQRYERWAAPLRHRNGVVQGLRLANRAIVWVFYAAYALLLGLILLGVPGGEGLLIPITAAPSGSSPGEVLLDRLSLAAVVVGIPALGFGLLSSVRAKLDAPRPAESAGIMPLVPRSGTGRSFPSRHAFSAFAIALCWWMASPLVAAGLLLLACLLAVLRVIAGVHYPRDVVAGAAVGMVTGALTVAAAEILRLVI